VPFVQQGIQGLGRSPLGNFLCVGIAYFIIAVIFPAAMFMLGGERPPDWTPYGITFATLAGVAGALGALCVIFANRAAAADYRLYIGPIIFAMAPLLNTLISLVWHASPTAGAFHFEFRAPHWTLYVGVVLVGAGASLVLYSKELSERPPVQTAQARSAPQPH
jgi:hypothetical protein